jgi:hypothetical protein
VASGESGPLREINNDGDYDSQKDERQDEEYLFGALHR